jgi:C1A family cysteine protease
MGATESKASPNLFADPSTIYNTNRMQHGLPRVDLRTSSCKPYMMVEDQGEAVSCVSHAFSMAYYCALRKADAQESYTYPRTTELYAAALEESSDRGRGVSFGAISNRIGQKHAREFDKYNLRVTELPNSVADLKNVLQRGFPIVVGYQVNSAIERFHKSNDACKEHGFILPSFSADPTPISGHTVLLVGYDDSIDGFLSRNSWGSDWGSDGHFLIRYADVEDENFFTDIMAIVGDGKRKEDSSARVIQESIDNGDMMMQMFPVGQHLS